MIFHKKEDDAETLNEVFVNTKANYTFTKHYVLRAQYDYDNRADGDRKVLGIGYGYKLLRTKGLRQVMSFPSYHIPKRSNS